MKEDSKKVFEIPPRVRDLIEQALAIEIEDAKKAGNLGFMARALVQATMPHKKAEGSSFLRKNGAFSLALTAHPEIGLPYGSVPRLLISYLTTEAIRTKEREIELGGTLTEFMTVLKEVPTGGRWGTITRVKDQTIRLFSSAVLCSYTAENRVSGMGFTVADKYDLWWNPKQPGQASMFTSTVTLGERFFDEVVNHPVPVDLRALAGLKKSPLALDIYCWLTYRMSYLSKVTVIPWEALQMQFGAEYGRTRDFKAAFIQHLKSVLLFYPEAKVWVLDNGLELRPSQTHIPKL